jgi:hypothetical protein
MKRLTLQVTGLLLAAALMAGNVTARAEEPVAPPKLDPAVQALLVAVLASVLQSMAANPAAGIGDPGPALESTVRKLLADPQSGRLVDGLLAQSFADLPAQIRDPLAIVVRNLLAGMRNDMLRELPPRDQSRAR